MNAGQSFLRSRAFAPSKREREDSQLVGSEDLGAFERAIEQSPLLIQNLLPFGGLGRQRDLEKSGALDRDANPVFVEDAGRFAHLFDGLRGVVRPPDVRTS